MKKVYVSPAFVINSVIMGVILLISLISLFVFAIMYRIEMEFIVLASLFGSWCGLSIICILVAFFSKKGFMYAIISETHLQTKMFHKDYCTLCWEDVKHIAFTNSFNYGYDTQPIYMVLSHNQIDSTHNIALSYNPKTQIVIRISENNCQNIIDNMTHKIDKDILVNLIDFHTMKSLLSVFEAVHYEKTDSGWKAQYK
ncbi:MAG: hypothetical protein E7581_04470 [Ruminococcaceae bacterium]|nr:hypothetical protein [Oscillospiraceae bacterium]